MSDTVSPGVRLYYTHAIPDDHPGGLQGPADPEKDHARGRVPYISTVPMVQP